MKRRSELASTADPQPSAPAKHAPTHSVLDVGDDDTNLSSHEANESDDDHDADTDYGAQQPAARRQGARMRWLVYGVLPGLALTLALTAGAMKWTEASAGTSESVRMETVQAPLHDNARG